MNEWARMFGEMKWKGRNGSTGKTKFEPLSIRMHKSGMDRSGTEPQTSVMSDRRLTS